MASNLLDNHKDSGEGGLQPEHEAESNLANRSAGNGSEGLHLDIRDISLLCAQLNVAMISGAL